MADQPAYQQFTHQHHNALLDPIHIALDSSDKGLSKSQGHMSPPDSASSLVSYGAHFPTAADQTPYAQQQQPQPQSHPQSSYGSSVPLPQALTLDPSHLRPSSVGPNRVLTRRQARMNQITSHALSSNAASSQHHHNFDQGFSINGTTANSSRPQSPKDYRIGAQYAEQHTGLSDLSIGTITSNTNGPRANGMSSSHSSPPTSASSSSGYSHYGFHPYASHSRSTSSSTNPRAASPTGSVMSSVTSLSSSSNNKHPAAPPLPLPPSTNAFTSGTKQKKRLMNKERKEICQYYIAHPNSRQEDIAARWGVERSTVSKILKHKAKWLAVSDYEDSTIAKLRPSKFPLIEVELTEWLSRMTPGTPISDAMIRAKAREVAKEMGITEDKFKASAGWVENFKHRQAIRKGVYAGPGSGLYEPDTESSDGDFVGARARQLARGERGVTAAELGSLVASTQTNPTNSQWHTTSDELTFSVAPVATPTARHMQDNVSSLGMFSMEHHNQAMFGNHLSQPFANGMMLPSHAVPGALPAHAFESSSGLGIYPPNLRQSVHDRALRFQHLAAIGALNYPGDGHSHSEGNEEVMTALKAKNALSRIVDFVRKVRPEFLTEQEDNLLTDIGHLLFYLSRCGPEGNAATSNSANTAANSVVDGGASTPPGPSVENANITNQVPDGISSTPAT